MFWTEFKHSSCPILAENQGLKNQGGSNRKMFFKFEKHQKNVEFLWIICHGVSGTEK